MKILAELYNLIEPSSIDRDSKEMKYPNVYKDRGKAGAKTKVSRKTVIIRRSSDGQIYGRRTIFSK